MNTEQEFIDQINKNSGKEPRHVELIYADYLLEEKGEELLAEGWRVLIERGKKPAKYYYTWNPPHHDAKWYWDDHHGLTKSSSLRFIGDPFDPQEKFKSYFDAINQAAIAYVRYTYDEGYGRPEINMTATPETTYNGYFDVEETEHSLGRITRRPKLDETYFLYGNLRYNPEELPIIKQAIISGEKVRLTIDVEAEPIPNPSLWKGGGSVTGIATIQHFRAEEDNLCDLEVIVYPKRKEKEKTRKAYKATCYNCRGRGYIPPDLKTSFSEECPVCGGRGVLP